MSKTKSIATMSRNERSLLLFIECAAVDKSGRFNSQHTNTDDFEILEGWREDGFINWGRICAAHLKPDSAHWVKLSPEAFALAHEERAARAARLWDSKTYLTTEEHRESTVEA